MAVEKRDGVWINTEFPGVSFNSRDNARKGPSEDFQKMHAQEVAMSTYDENVAATEALDGAEDVEADALVSEAAQEFPEAESFAGGFDREEQELTDVVRETAKEVRARENVVYMALYANSAPARAYWRKLAEENGYELPAEDVTDATA
jgi:hypothetical protein